MSDKSAVKATRWRDPEGNVYGIEKAVRNGRYVIIRVNAGGNRKAARQFSIAGSAPFMQKQLNDAAKANNWTEVTE